MADIGRLNSPDLSGVPARDVARTFLRKSCDPSHAAEDSRDILEEGFTRIMSSPSLSEEEKNLAELGKSFRTAIPERYASTMAMLTLMHHFAASSFIPGPVGSVLAKECCAIVEGTKCFYEGESNAIDIFRAGFRQIRENPRSTEVEKTIARFGEEISSTPLYFRDGMLGSYAAMAALGTSTGTPLGPCIAKISIRAADASEMPFNARSMLDRGFATIMSGQETSPREKELARFGSHITGEILADDDIAAFAKLLVMDEIAAPPRKTGDSIARIAIGYYDELHDINLSDDMCALALQTILESPTTVDEEKALIRGTIKDEVKDADFLTKLTALRSIVEFHEGKAPAGKKAEEDLSTIEGDEMVIVGGIKLDRQHT